MKHKPKLKIVAKSTQGHEPEGLVIHTTNGLYKIRRKDFIRYNKVNKL